MNIVVCIKQVVDTNDIKWTKNNTIDRDGAQSIINPCDLLAIETALRLKNDNTKISVISMGPPQAKEALKEALAMGCDEAFLLCDKKFSGADTAATSKTISTAINHICPNFDLIICGQFASDGDTAQTGPSIAQKLKIEQITYVNEIIQLDFEKEKSVTVIRTADEYIEVVRTPLPALICVNDCPYQARNILIDGYIKAQNTTIKVINAEDLQLNIEEIGIKGSPTWVSKAFRAVSHRENKITIPNSTQEAINIIENIIETKTTEQNTSTSKAEYKRKTNNTDIKKNKILIFGEIDKNDDLIKSVYELTSKANELAQNIDNCEISIITTGKKTTEYINLLEKFGADELIELRNENLKTYNTKNFANAIFEYIKQNKITIFLISATKQGRDLAPYIASMLKTGLTADCTALEIYENNLLAATRPTFGGELMATILCKTLPQMATIRPGVFTLNETTPKTIKLITIEPVLNELSKKNVIKKTSIIRDENSLENAKIVFGGGKGLKDKETFNKLRKLAQLLNAKVGASRKAVDAQLATYNEQIGQTGKTISPEIYIALGISGAIQHYIGVENAKKIIAINTNKNAPITKNADLTIITDARQIIDEWLNKLEQN